MTFNFKGPINFSSEPLKPNLETDVEEVLGGISKLFRNKNEQYRTDTDDLANFTKGAYLLGREADEAGRFAALKGYVAKHIAKVYDGELGDAKMDESIMDIAVYFILAAVMHKRMKNEILAPRKPIQEAYWIDGDLVKRCSKCKGTVNASCLYEYCPHCGAFVDKVVERNE